MKKQKLSILIDTRMINFSGIGRYLRNIIPFLIYNEDLKVILLGNPIEIKKCNFNKDIEIIEANSKIYSIKEQIEIPLKIKTISSSIDIFWSPHFNVPILPIKVKKRLVTIHDVFHLAFFNQLTFMQKNYARIMFERAVNLSNIIITDSEFSKSEIIKYIKVDKKHIDKIRVIHCGINKNMFRIIKEKDKLEIVKNKHNLPEKFILYVGNVKPHKNLIGLLKAFNLFIEKNGKNGKNEEKFEDYKLVIIGKKEGFITADKEIFKILEANPNLKNKVLFTDYVENEDLPLIYNLANIFVLPSFYEGFGLPPLEAMASGTPAIVSNLASLPEICGEAAYYVNPHNINELADGIYKVLNDSKLQNELIRKGLERIKLFNWEQTAEKLINIILATKNTKKHKVIQESKED